MGVKNPVEFKGIRTKTGKGKSRNRLERQAEANFSVRHILCGYDVQTFFLKFEDILRLSVDKN